MRRYNLSNIQLGADGVVIEYGDIVDDVRANGMGRRQQLFVPVEVAEVADELEALQLAAEALLDTAVVAFTLSPSAPAFEPDDDERSPYDNPLERDHVEVKDD